MYRITSRILGAVLVIVASLPVGFSQTSTANVTGLISDPAGAAIPGVKVTIENVATHEKRATTSGGEGRFIFSQILPGVYDLVAEATGFKSFTERGITLVSGQSGAVNVSMQIGDLSQRVEVGSAPLPVDTQTANQAVTLERAMVLAFADESAQPVYPGACHRWGDCAGDRHFAVSGGPEPGPLRIERRSQHDDGYPARRRERLGGQ